MKTETRLKENIWDKVLKETQEKGKTGAEIIVDICIGYADELDDENNLKTFPAKHIDRLKRSSLTRPENFRGLIEDFRERKGWLAGKGIDLSFQVRLHPNPADSAAVTRWKMENAEALGLSKILGKFTGDIDEFRQREQWIAAKNSALTSYNDHPEEYREFQEGLIKDKAYYENRMTLKHTKKEKTGKVVGGQFPIGEDILDHCQNEAWDCLSAATPTGKNLFIHPTPQESSIQKFELHSGRFNETMKCVTQKHPEILGYDEVIHLKTMFELPGIALAVTPESEDSPESSSPQPLSTYATLMCKGFGLPSSVSPPPLRDATSQINFIVEKLIEKTLLIQQQRGIEDGGAVARLALDAYAEASSRLSKSRFTQFGNKPTQIESKLDNMGASIESTQQKSPPSLPSMRVTSN